MALEYKFLGRDKLAKGYSYPIKRGDLDQALEEADVMELNRVSYTCHVGKRQKRELVLSANMSGEAIHPGMIVHRTPKIGIYAVPVDRSQRIKKLLEKHDALNQLGRWLKELESAESVRRDHTQYFEVYFENNKLGIDKTE